MKSPFWGATKYQIQEYKRYAGVISQWRRDMEVGCYSQPPMHIMDTSAYAGNWQGMALHNFIRRAYARLHRHPHWTDMAEWFAADKMRRENPAGYKVYLLSKEFEEYRKKCNCCHHPH